MCINRVKRRLSSPMNIECFDVFMCNGCALLLLSKVKDFLSSYRGKYEELFPTSASFYDDKSARENKKRKIGSPDKNTNV